MEGTKETFPLTFDPVTVQPTRAWVCYMGGEGQSHPSLFIILLFLPQPIPPLSSPPLSAPSDRGGTWCAGEHRLSACV